jgi:hypothetical protein
MDAEVIGYIVMEPKLVKPMPKIRADHGWSNTGLSLPRCAFDVQFGDDLEHRRYFSQVDWCWCFELFAELLSVEDGSRCPAAVTSEVLMMLRDREIRRDVFHFVFVHGAD